MTALVPLPAEGDPHARPTPLCRSCQTERGRWLDYRMPPTLGIAYGSGARYDATPAGIADRRRAAFENWRETIRFNQDLIARTCREQGHTVAHATPMPAVVQIPLLDLIEGSEAA